MRKKQSENSIKVTVLYAWPGQVYRGITSDVIVQTDNRITENIRVIFIFLAP